MMRWLVEHALRLRIVVVALTAAFAVIAALVVSRAPFDVFPEFAPPLVEIQTEAPGLSTEEVERLITVPLEYGLTGTAFVETIRSKSVLGLSSVVLWFKSGTDVLQARQLVQERLARIAATLPAVAHPPVLLSPLSSTSRVLKVGLTSATLSQMDLTTLALWTIRPRLIAVPGVANVAIWGQRDRQLQVLVNPDRLRAHQVSLDDVIRAAGEAVALSGGGFVDLPNQRLAVSQPPTVEGLAQLAAAPVVVRRGVPLPIGAIADVGIGHQAPIGDAVINDGPGLLLIVEKQPWGNTLSITRGVEAALEALRPALGDVAMDASIFRPATFIERSLANLNRALLIGCVLVVLTLVAFLRDWRTSVISLTAIPLSLLTAALVIRYRGGTLDTMVLAGLVIALGEVVDDAIIDVEKRDLGSVAREVEAAVGRLAFEPGYHPEFLGEYAAQQAAQRRLLGLAALSLLGITLILYTDFETMRLTALLLLTLPFALVGGIWAVVATGATLSLGSLVGLVTVLGIAARNGIMLVSHYRHLEQEEGMPFGPELVVRGAQERLLPILMTALVTALALVPLVVFGNRPGHEIEHPMAIVILGGLVSSTLLNLFLVPPLYYRYGKGGETRRSVVVGPRLPAEPTQGELQTP